MFPLFQRFSWEPLEGLGHYQSIMQIHSRYVALGAALVVSAVGIAKSFQGEVAASAAEAKPIKTGVMAPDATLKALDGKETKLKSVLGGKPTVLIFYRGGWCPFCNAHLSELAKIEGDIRAKGYQIVAISPDTPAELSKTMDKDHVTYRLYSDSPAEAIKKFGIAFRVDDDTFTMYRDRYKIDLERSSGMTHHILPVPSVFVVDKSGKIIFSHSNPDYKVRLKGEEILKALN